MTQNGRKTLQGTGTEPAGLYPHGLVQPSGGLRFGLDALLLAAFTAQRLLAWPGQRDIFAVELGCGCGAALLGAALAASWVWRDNLPPWLGTRLPWAQSVAQQPDAAAKGDAAKKTAVKPEAATAKAAQKDTTDAAKTEGGQPEASAAQVDSKTGHKDKAAPAAAPSPLDKLLPLPKAP